MLSNVILLWDGRLDAAVSSTYLFYVVSISEGRHFICKCYVSRIVQFLQFNLKNLILFVCDDCRQCAVNKITLYVYWAT